MSKPNPLARSSANWLDAEPLFKGGIVSVASIAQSLGVSRAAVYKHADKMGWRRDLKPQVLARASEIVEQVDPAIQVAHAANASPKAESAAVEVNAHAVAIVLIGQRNTIKRLRAVNDALLADMEREMSKTPRRRLPLADRVKTQRVLVESSRISIGLERQSFGLDDNQKPPEDHDSFESLRDLAEKG